jgi:uncharacterized membrane protein
MARLEPLHEQGSWSELIAGIVTDATRLFAKEIELAKLEIRTDARNAKALLLGIATGALIALLGAGLLGVALALAIFTYTTLPQWACFAIVGGVMLLAGIVFLAIANRNKKKFDFIPQRTANAVKEDIRWINSTIKTSNAISQTANKPERR